MRTARPRRAGSGASLRDIRLLVLDVDGVLTDGRLWFGPRGELLKVFDVRDGLGLRRVLDAGIAVAIISGRSSAATRARARELGIPHVFQGVKDKLARFETLRRELGLDASQCACIGDDEPDAAILRAAGASFAVADAHESARRAAQHVTRAGGGRGAVREVCDLLLAARRKATLR